MTSKCLVLQPVHADGLAMLRDSGVEPVICPDTREETIARLGSGCRAAITRNFGFPSAFFDLVPELEVISIHGTGYDAVDTALATERGILVCNAPGANARSVAELALGLSIAAARLIPAADRAVRRGETGFREHTTFFELHGKTALIVGWGAVGRLFAEMLEALGVTVVVYSPRAPDVASFERVSDLAVGLSRADIVSLHTPMRDSTRALIGHAALASVKPGAFLINTARAGLVDEEALAVALKNGRIGAAALDVYSDDAPNGPLAQTNRVIFTPHLGGTTEAASRRTAMAAARNVITALAGGTPGTSVNLPVGRHAASPAK